MTHPFFFAISEFLLMILLIRLMHRDGETAVAPLLGMLVALLLALPFTLSQ